MPQTPRWSVVLFDLDGTLANSIDLIVASYAYAFDTVTGRQITRAEACQWIGQTLPVTFFHEDPANSAALEVAYREYNNAHLDQITPYPGVFQLLDDLRSAGVATGVVTAKGRDAGEASLQVMGMTGLIPVIVARQDTTEHKPHAAPLLAALDKSGASPNQAAYVGDAVWDVMAAQAARMTAIAVTWGAGVEDELAALRPDALCHDVAELCDVLLLGTDE